MENRNGMRMEMIGEMAGGIIHDFKNPIEVRVNDNGPGIPEEIRAALFEPFVTQGKKKGAGLGMAIAKANIEAHGGTITFSSEEGEGTTFIIRLPIAEATPREAGEGAGAN